MLTMMNEETSKLVEQVEAMSLYQLKKIAVYGDYLINDYTVKQTFYRKVSGYKIGKFHFLDLHQDGRLFEVYTDMPLSLPIPGDRKPKGITQALKALWLIDQMVSSFVREDGSANWDHYAVEDIGKVRDQIQAAIYSITH